MPRVDQSMHPSPNETRSSGLLIAFEGIDGTGKSTQLHLLAAALRAMGFVVVTTREPTDGEYGRRIRTLYEQRHSVSRAEELELFLADRRQHVLELIGPALAQGKIVLTDRYYLSTVAYQGANGLDPHEILCRNEAFAPKPDLVLLLQISPAAGVHRIQALRQQTLNDFEQETELHKVAAIFDSMAGEYIQRIDASRSIHDVHLAVMDAVRSALDGCASTLATTPASC